METHDSRSFKLVILADYFVNPQSYANLPAGGEVYEILRDAGVGIIKMPPPGISEQSLEGWITITADQVEEYSKRGYKVFILGVEQLEGNGVWIDRLERELQARGVQKPTTINLTSEQLKAGGESIKKTLSTILSG
ncbi:MAG: hypothetical protein NXY59_02190 [Aigarchaeota archaeon]|nr:hypothetical protein [Candidatus Pelearchaeum maunauluense]